MSYSNQAAPVQLQEVSTLLLVQATTVALCSFILELGNPLVAQFNWSQGVREYRAGASSCPQAPASKRVVCAYHQGMQHNVQVASQ